MEARDYSKEVLQDFIADQVHKSKVASDEANARREKIENLKAMIRAGLYDVSSEHIAEKLVSILAKKVRIQLV